MYIHQQNFMQGGQQPSPMSTPFSPQPQVSPIQISTPQQMSPLPMSPRQMFAVPQQQQQMSVAGTQGQDLSQHPMMSPPIPTPEEKTGAGRGRGRVNRAKGSRARAAGRGGPTNANANINTNPNANAPMLATMSIIPPANASGKTNRTKGRARGRGKKRDRGEENGHDNGRENLALPSQDELNERERKMVKEEVVDEKESPGFGMHNDRKSKESNQGIVTEPITAGANEMGLNMDAGMVRVLKTEPKSETREGDDELLMSDGGNIELDVEWWRDM